jgi:hypothetical protein
LALAQALSTKSHQIHTAAIGEEFASGFP